MTIADRSVNLVVEGLWDRVGFGCDVGYMWDSGVLNLNLEADSCSLSSQDHVR